MIAMNLKLTKQQVEDILDSYQWIVDESKDDPDLMDDPLYKIYFDIKAQFTNDTVSYTHLTLPTKRIV